MEIVKIGIIICDRYRTCAGGIATGLLVGYPPCPYVDPVISDEATRISYD